MDTETHPATLVRVALATAIAAALLLATASEVEGQRSRPLRPLAAVPLAPLTSAARPGPSFDARACAGLTVPADPVLAEISLALRGDEPAAALERIRSMEPAVRREATDAPHDLALQHRLAALLGAVAVLEGGRAKIAAAREVHVQAERVLALDDSHPGAHHILGRLHAGVMRIDRLTRFLATRLLGGGALAGASWERAQGHLEVAERGEPCLPEHHMELARLYRERSEPEAALAEAGHVLALTEATDDRWQALRREAGELLAELGGRAHDAHTQDAHTQDAHATDRSLSLAAPRSTTNSSGGHPGAHPPQRR